MTEQSGRDRRTVYSARFFLVVYCVLAYNRIQKEDREVERGERDEEDDSYRI